MARLRGLREQDTGSGGRSVDLPQTDSGPKRTPASWGDSLIVFIWGLALRSATRRMLARRARSA